MREGRQGRWGAPASTPRAHSRTRRRGERWGAADRWADDHWRWGPPRSWEQGDQWAADEGSDSGGRAPRRSYSPASDSRDSADRQGDAWEEQRGCRLKARAQPAGMARLPLPPPPPPPEPPEEEPAAGVPADREARPDADVPVQNGFEGIEGAALHPKRAPGPPKPLRLVGPGGNGALRGRSRSYSVSSRRESSASGPRGARCGPSSSSSSPVQPRTSGRRARLFDVAPRLGGPAQTAAVPPGQKLEALLDAAASLGRTAVGEVMVFCLDNSSAGRKHATQVVDRILDRPPGPLQNRDVAALYCLSDVLYNAGHAHRNPGATVYRHTFQDALPGMMHRLHEALNEDSNGSGQSGSSVLALRLTAEAAVQRLFKVWGTWEVFPAFFLQGLEAVMFGGALAAPTSASPPVPGASATPPALSGRPEDTAVRSRMEAYGAMDLPALERQCKNRGLVVGGSQTESASRVTLLSRLRSFEEYWAHRSSKGAAISSTSSAPAPPPQSLEAEEDVDGEPVDMSELLRLKALRKAKKALEKAAKLTAPSAKPSLVSVDEDLDGEPIGVLELQRWRAAAAAGTVGGGIIASSASVAVPASVAPKASQDLDGTASDFLGSAQRRVAAQLTGPCPRGQPAADVPAEPPHGSQQPHPEEAPALAVDQTVAKDGKPARRKRRGQHAHASRKEGRVRRRDRSSRRARHSKQLQDGQERRRDRSRRRRRREAQAAAAAANGVPVPLAPPDSVEAAAAAAAEAAANAAAFLSARSRAPAALPVVAPPPLLPAEPVPAKVVSPAHEVAAGDAACSNTSSRGTWTLGTAREPTPEPDDELDGDPLDSGDEQHVMLQEKLAEKKRRLMQRFFK